MERISLLGILNNSDEESIENTTNDTAIEIS